MISTAITAPRNLTFSVDEQRFDFALDGGETKGGNFVAAVVSAQ